MVFPAHRVERNLVCCVVFPLRTDGYPKVSPVVVGPIVLNGIFVNEVCSLLVVSEWIGFEPKGVRIGCALLQVGRPAEHAGVADDKTSGHFAVAFLARKAVLHFFAGFGLLFAGRYVFDVWHGTSAFGRNLNEAAIEMLLACVVYQSNVVHANLIEFEVAARCVLCAEKNSLIARSDNFPLLCGLFDKVF